MTHLFDRLEQASGLFVRGEYAKVIPVLDRILADDPTNLDATLRLIRFRIPVFGVGPHEPVPVGRPPLEGDSCALGGLHDDLLFSRDTALKSH
jgi:hypothetical protein